MDEPVIFGKKVCIICFPDLGSLLAESVHIKGAREIDLQAHANAPFPRDYDTYIMHLSNVHGPEGKFDKGIIQKLRVDNPNCKIYVFSGGDNQREEVRDIVTGTYNSLNLVSFVDDLK